MTGKKHTAETIAKISEARTGKTGSFTGRKHSAETIEVEESGLELE